MRPSIRFSSSPSRIDVEFRGWLTATTVSLALFSVTVREERKTVLTGGTYLLLARPEPDSGDSRQSDQEHGRDGDLTSHIFVDGVRYHRTTNKKVRVIAF